MSTITVNNAAVHYESYGSGPRLVLVHGTGSGGGAFVWADLLESFTQHHTVVLPDLSGTHNTVDDGAELTAESLAEQVIAVIEDSGEDGEDAVDLMGFSLGGTVAAVVAALRPDLVHNLICVAGFAHGNHSAFQQSMRLWQSLANDPERFGHFATITAFSPGFVGTLDDDTLAGVNNAMQPDEGTLRHIDLNLRLDIRGLLPRVKARTLVVGNEKDATVPNELTKAIADGVADSSYITFNSGHITLAEQPEQFLASVRSFLS